MKKIESKEIKKLGYTPTVQDVVNSAEYIYTQTNSIRVACSRMEGASKRITEAAKLSGVQCELGYLKEHTDKLVAACNEIFLMFAILSDKK